MYRKRYNGTRGRKYTRPYFPLLRVPYQRKDPADGGMVKFTSVCQYVYTPVAPPPTVLTYRNAIAHDYTNTIQTTGFASVGVGMGEPSLFQFILNGGPIAGQLSIRLNSTVTNAGQAEILSKYRQYTIYGAKYHVHMDNMNIAGSTNSVRYSLGMVASQDFNQPANNPWVTTTTVDNEPYLPQLIAKYPISAVISSPKANSENGDSDLRLYVSSAKYFGISAEEYRTHPSYRGIISTATDGSLDGLTDPSLQSIVHLGVWSHGFEATGAVAEVPAFTGWIKKTIYMRLHSPISGLNQVEDG